MTTRPSTAHMSPDDFRRHGRDVIDWIADYLETCEKRPVLSQVKPGCVREKLPPAAPRSGEPFEAMMRDVDEIILPGITHWQSPNFFGFFPANSSYPAILGELLSAGLGVQGMLWATSPACTELEMHVLDWLVEMLGLPEKFRFASLRPPVGEGRGEGVPAEMQEPSPPAPLPAGIGRTRGGGVIQDTASSATLCAMIAARERATTLASNRSGTRQPLVAYTSTQAHSSVEKAAKICGIGSENLRLIEVDEQFRMRPAALAAAIDVDRRRGLTPFFVCATIGTTSSNAIDPVREIGEVLAGGTVESAGDSTVQTQRGRPVKGARATSAKPDFGRRAPHTAPIWLHVDAAMSGTAALCPEFRWIHDGLELADSYCFNPHKWMLTNFDCDCFWVADKAALINALSILPEYLRNRATESGAVTDYRDWQVPLGRRFRALKLWFVIRHYGVEGLQAHVREHVRLAQRFAQWIEDDPDFELLGGAGEFPGVPVERLNLVCFRHKGGDDINQRILDALNASGDLYLTHTKLEAKFTLRMAIGQWRTREGHVKRAWERIREETQRAAEGRGGELP